MDLSSVMLGSHCECELHYITSGFLLVENKTQTIGGSLNIGSPSSIYNNKIYSCDYLIIF